MKGLPLLKAPYHFLVVLIEAIALCRDQYLECRAFSMLCYFCECSEKHVHRVMLVHLRRFQRIRGMLCECRVCGGMFSPVVEDVVIAPLFLYPCVGKYRGHKKLCQILFLSRHGEIQ